jgi:hypothetical protein
MNRALFIILVFLSFPALAQPVAGEGKEGEIIGTPICTDLTNRSAQMIIGTITTASQTIDTGDVVKHRSNFRLDAGAKQKICAAGPFFEGRRVMLVIRTLIPLFECKTTLEKEIFLDATPQDNGTTKLSATCS